MDKIGKYPLLYNKDWLYDQYISNKRSLNDIGKELGCDCKTVSQSLKRYDIQVRSKSEGHTINRIDDGFIMDVDVINGGLLGDASLHINNIHSNGKGGMPSFKKKNIGYDHISFVASKLFSVDYKSRIIECLPTENSLPNTKPIFSLFSLTHKELLPLFKEWYPESNSYKKIIPSTIDMNPTVLLHWFMDDGYSYFVNRKYENYNKTSIRVQFATQCFSKSDLLMLSEKCKDSLGLTITPRHHQKNGVSYGYFMELSEKQISLFYDIIGSCPVASMQYKWKG